VQCVVTYFGEPSNFNKETDIPSFGDVKVTSPVNRLHGQVAADVAGGAASPEVVSESTTIQ